MDEVQERPKTTTPNLLTRKLQATRQFYRDIKLEMRRVTWPARQDVYATTIVTVVVVFFFGYFLWGTNWVLSLAVKEVIDFFSK
jgi:preprotein translocase subunit SecE